MKLVQQTKESAAGTICSHPMENRVNKLKSGIKNGTDVHQMWLVILMMKLIFYINFYWLLNKFEGFVKLLRTFSSANVKSSKTQLSNIEKKEDLLAYQLVIYVRVCLKQK